MQLQKLNRDDIIDEKWDECVRQSTNGVIYAFTWYLDIVCDEWEGLVLNDYELIIPLPIKHYSFISCVTMPFGAPQLGVINENPISDIDTLNLLKQIPYLNVSLTLNAHNKLPKQVAENYTVSRYSVLDLILSLKNIKLHFLPELNEVISLFENKKITVIRSLNPTEYCDFLKENEAVTEREVSNLTRLISFSIRYKSAGIYAAFDEQNNLLSEAFFVRSSNSLSLLNFATRDGDPKQLGVQAIVYHVIKNNAESNLTMEFPYRSDLVGRFFSQTEHVCINYHKGWLNKLV